MKAPCLSIALPPKLAPEGGEPFPEIPLGFTPYRHQRIAHQRLARAQPQSAQESGPLHRGANSPVIAPFAIQPPPPSANPWAR